MQKHLTSMQIGTNKQKQNENIRNDTVRSETVGQGAPTYDTDYRSPICVYGGTDETLAVGQIAYKER